MQTNILFKNVVIIDKNSPFHLQKVDIYINQNHIIEKIDKKIENISTSEATIIECEENFASIGWVDMHSHISEIGLEHKETLYSGSRAAAKGGFTTVCTLPNTKPVIQTKNEISFIKNNPHQIIEILPIAAVTIDTLGKDLTEMIDLHHAGAVAFSDGENSLENSDMVRKILLYLQKFDGLLIQKAQDNYLAKFGQIHEGKIATLLGLKGLPSLAEEIIIQRDLKLLAYTGGKIHFTLISTADSVQQIREAKQKGLQVTCSVAAHQLAFTEEMLISLDTNLKVNPPFRTENDRKALITGLQDGTIDAIVSAHLPQDIENKLLEFDMAEFGAIGLETCFAVSNTFSELSIENLIEKLAYNPRKILKLHIPIIQVGEKANLTIFSTQEDWKVTENQLVSISKNSPFLNHTLKGKVKNIYWKGIKNNILKT